MFKILGVLVATSVLAAPANAADWQFQGEEVQRGAFVGARFKISLGGQTRSRPGAELAIAPAQSRNSYGGRTSMKIGDGIALNFTPGVKPALTLAGQRADKVLGLQRDRDFDSDEKLGISTGGWIAIGLGTAAAIVGGLYLAVDDAMDCDEDEGVDCS